MIARWCLVLAVVGFFGANASAQPTPLEPASCLIFPLFDSGPGMKTVINVTNTNDSRRYCEATDFREGETIIHYLYTDPELGLDEFRYEFLAPGDTLTVIADKHSPLTRRGFLIVTARNPSDLESSDFDYLLGSAVVIDLPHSRAWKYVPYGFEAIVESADGCAPESTDVDGDGAADFDGVEYANFPDMIFSDGFFEQSGQFGSRLAILTFNPPDSFSGTEFLFWNNIEDKFSRTLLVDRWWTGTLSEVSAIVTHFGGDEDELGRPPTQLGWLSLEGGVLVDDRGEKIRDKKGNVIPSAVLAVLMQTVEDSRFAVGGVLHIDGERDGFQYPIGEGDE